tara:strand:+ start:37881 stop:39395 length:1515 start_codon:yes stop_codon:yes gene_type:complete
MEIDLSKYLVEAKEKKTLNKPFRTPNGPKKFSVYVKNEKGNVVKVNFGDPNMEIKRDDPDRRKNFRARHNCDNPGPKTKARYWSCKMWEAKKSVTDYTKGSEDWDGETIYDFDQLLSVNPALAFVEEEITEDDDCKCDNGCGRSDEESEAALTEKQKKLPPALQKAILKKQGKSPKKEDEENEGDKKKEENKKDSKDDKPTKGLTEKQKKLPVALQKAILKKQGKASEEESMEEKYASLWKNIHEKRKRIKSGSGEKMRKKGEEGAPTPEQMKKAKADSEDHEVSMAEAQLRKISKLSSELAVMMAAMPEDANIMAWVQDKISKAEHFVEAAYDYMSYKNSDAEYEEINSSYDMSEEEYSEVMTLEDEVKCKDHLNESDFESSAAKRRGPKSAAQTPAAPSERRRGSSRNKKGSAGKSGPAITFSEKTTLALRNKVKEHNSKYSKKVTLSQLKKVYRRGAGAFSGSHRPGQSRGSWAMARVNMFLKMKRGGKVKQSYRAADGDI